MTPLVSVVIPNYNNGRFLAEAIQSVLDQTYRPIDVIVVDDGSTDESSAIADRYRDRVRWIAQAHRGVGAARNRGIAASDAPFIAFLDADDSWHPEKLAQQMPLFTSPDIGLVFCGIQYIDLAGHVLGENIAGPEGDTFRQIAMLERTIAIGSTPVIRRECFARVGVFEETLKVAEDWDLCRRIAGAYRVVGVQRPLARYRQHPDNVHHDVDLMRRDTQRALDRMFADPAAHAVHHLRRRILARFHMIVAGSYAHSRRGLAAGREAAHAIWLWPPLLFTVLWRGIRRVGRVSEVRRISKVARARPAKSE